MVPGLVHWCLRCRIQNQCPRIRPSVFWYSDHAYNLKRTMITFTTESLLRVALQSNTHNRHHFKDWKPRRKLGTSIFFPNFKIIFHSFLFALWHLFLAATGNENRAKLIVSSVIAFDFPTRKNAVVWVQSSIVTPTIHRAVKQTTDTLLRCHVLRTKNKLRCVNVGREVLIGDEDQSSKYSPTFLGEKVQNDFLWSF